MLSADKLAASMLVIRDDLVASGLLAADQVAVQDEGVEGEGALLAEDELNTSRLFATIRPVSAATGAGIHSLWKDLLRCADAVSVPQNAPQAVREHKLASLVRALGR